MKKYLLIFPLVALFVFSCKIKKEESGENVTTQTDETQAVKDEAVKEETPASDAQSGKTYTVADFVDAYSKDKSAFKGQTVIVEGYYLNYNFQNDGTGEQYSIMLYSDEACDFKGKKVYFMFGTATNEKDFSMPQYSKIKIQGKVTGEESFDDPKLVDAKIVK